MSRERPPAATARVSRRSRRNSWIPRTRAAFALLGAVSERLCSCCAEWLFLRPPRYRLSTRERCALDASRREFVRSGADRIALWRWGNGPLVLLVHGWGGHAGRLSAFVKPLVSAGFSVAALEAPGHGSSSGVLATLPDFVRSIRAVADQEEPFLLVGHSLGAAACALALTEGVRARGAVLLAPPANPGAYVARFTRFFRLRPSVAAGVHRRLETRYRTRLSDFRLTERAAPVPLLVFHDRRDGCVSVRDAHALAGTWPSTELVLTRGLGHHKILRAPSVVRRTVRFARSLRDGVALENRPIPGDPGRESRSRKRSSRVRVLLPEIAG